MNEIQQTTDNALIPFQYEALDRNPAAVYLASLGKRSRETQMYSLKAIVAIVWPRSIGNITEADVYAFPWHELRYQQTTAIRTKLAETYNHSSANRSLAALRRVLKECWRLGYIDNETMARACDIENIKGETVPRGRDVTDGEIHALTSVCYRDIHEAAGIRDMALIAVLAVTGMRRNELAGLLLSDYTPDEGKLHIRHGKGNKDRIVYVDNGAKAALDDWLALRGNEAGALFLPVNKGGRIIRETGDNGLKGISAQSVYDMLKRRGTEADIADFSPHDLRRTFVGDMLEAGVDISTVQKIAGHASTNTTARYDRRGEKAKQDAIKKLHFPYRKRRKLTG